MYEPSGAAALFHCTRQLLIRRRRSYSWPLRPLAIGALGALGAFRALGWRISSSICRCAYAGHGAARLSIVGRHRFAQFVEFLRVLLERPVEVAAKSLEILKGFDVLRVIFVNLQESGVSETKW
jgi:hypothetical protein